MTDPRQPRNPWHTGDCGACGAPVFEGRMHTGEIRQLDLKAKVYAAVGARDKGGTEIVLTEMAMVDHAEVCPYKDA